MRSHLLEGTVGHRRSRPVVYALQHDVYYLALDLDELDAVDRRLRLLSRNRRNLLAFRDADHWPVPATDLRTSVLGHLRGEGEDPTGWRITLVTNARVFGYVFNPASFYLCRDADGVLRVVIVEVHNTHLERHLYTLRPSAADGPFRASMTKAFYVSPFIDMEGGYTVHVDDAHQAGRAVLGRRVNRPLTQTIAVRFTHLSVELLRRRDFEGDQIKGMAEARIGGDVEVAREALKHVNEAARIGAVLLARLRDDLLVQEAGELAHVRVPEIGDRLPGLLEAAIALLKVHVDASARGDKRRRVAVDERLHVGRGEPEGEFPADAGERHDANE